MKKTSAQRSRPQRQRMFSAGKRAPAIKRADQPPPLEESQAHADEEPHEKPIEIPNLAQWHADVSRKPLLNVTLDQLRTLVVLKACGSPLDAARAMSPRQQSSVLAQINTLNKYFEVLCGEPLARKQTRGQPYALTPTGREAVGWAEHVLQFLDDGIRKQAQKGGHHLLIGATAFTAPLIGHVIGDLRRDIDDVVVDIIQVRTKDRWAVLKNETVKLVLGAVVLVDGDRQVPPGFSFLPAGDPDGCALLTNLTVKELPATTLDDNALKRQPMILPEGGIIIDVLEAVYREHYLKHVSKTGPRISDIHYGLNMLRYDIVRGSMLVLASVGQWIDEGGLPASASNAPSPQTLRLISLAGQFGRVKVQAGLFARTADLKSYSESHPVSRFWKLFQQRMKTSPIEG